MFIVTNKEYRSGVWLNEYNGSYSLLDARRNQKGEPSMRWCVPVGAERKLPIGVRIGDKARTIEVLEGFLEYLKGGEEPAGGNPSSPTGEDDSFIPF